LRTKKIDIINIGLIIFSFILALKLPFELFIFSYVVLGPLHYLTEISWLKKNNYFVHSRKWIWVFIFLALLITIPSFFRLPEISGLYEEIILIMFLFAIGLVYFNKWQYILLSLILSAVLGFFIIEYVPFSFIVAGVFLPTIIHVYLFTLLFMILGAINNKSREGLIGVMLVILCPVIISVLPIIPADYVVSAYTETSYLTSKFSDLSSYLAQMLSLQNGGRFYHLSEIGIKIQIFIAFCYTYHYLNWFSKTSIIGWSRSLSKTKIVIVVLIWSFSLFLYWYNFKLGYIALFFFSMLHVVLEFPLNIKSMKGIIRLVREPRHIKPADT